MLPNFLVIGAEKAGSTYLLNCIREHPHVFMPRSEIPFFEDFFFEEVGVKKFESFFDDALVGQVVGMKRPNLLGHPECPERIHNILPAAKLIVTLRQPVERFVSAYYHFASFNFIPIEPIEVGARKLLRGEWDSFPRAHELLEFGMYGKHLTNYLDYFSRDQLHVNLFDDIKNDSKKTLSQVYSFLSIDPSFEPSAIKSRPMRAIYSTQRLKVRNILAPFYQDWSVDQKYTLYRKNPIYYFNMFVDRYLYSILFSKEQPKLSKDLGLELYRYFEQDINLTEEIINRPLTAWRPVMV